MNRIFKDNDGLIGVILVNKEYEIFFEVLANTKQLIANSSAMWRGCFRLSHRLSLSPVVDPQIFSARP